MSKYRIIEIDTPNGPIFRIDSKCLWWWDRVTVCESLKYAEELIRHWNYKSSPPKIVREY